jgi:hypothetical protein
LIHCVAEALLTASYVRTGLGWLGLSQKRTGVAGRNIPQRWEAESRRIEAREEAYSR